MTTKIICSAILSASLALQSMAGEKLKLELIAPEQPFVISKDQLQKAEAEAGKINTPDKEALKNLENAPSPEKRAEWLRRVMQDRQQQPPQTQQGIVLGYRITNLSDEEIVLEHGGDSAVNDLELKGPGAVNVPFRGMMNLSFEMGTPFTLSPGRSKEFMISELEYGERNKSRWLITRKGDYEVTLIHRIHTSQGGEVVLKSNTVNFSVVSK